MMRRERRAAPLFALLIFEVIAIIGLQAAGSNQAMQVPWGDFWTWLNTNSVDTLAMPLLRYAALGLAYWMLASTLLFVAAQLTRIPVAIRAAGMFTLPSVRRAVDGAMAVSIATTSVVGFASAAVAFDGSSSTSSTSIANLVSGDLTLGGGVVAPPAGGNSVGTPTFQAAAGSTANPSANSSASTTTTTVASADDSSTGDNSSTGNVGDVGDATGAGDATDTGVTDPATTTSGTDNSLVTTSSTPSTTSSTIAQADDSQQATTSLAPSAGSDFVPTPRPGAPITTTTVPQGPSTPATTPTQTPTPTPPAPSVNADSSTHTVVPGDNLWNISRDHIAETSGRDKHSISEVEIRTYWLKVIDANRNTIRSHDPHWIFPGEIITLPALDGSVAGS